MTMGNFRAISQSTSPLLCPTPPVIHALQTPPPPGIYRLPQQNAKNAQNVKILFQQPRTVTYKTRNRMKIFARHGWHQNARGEPGIKNTK